MKLEKDARETALLSPDEAASAPAAAPPLSSDLEVVKKSKGPVMTVLEEFYKVGPGPSSSHTMGPMRITYDFYQRCTQLPPDQLAKATGMKVHLFGSLSATGVGHGTERAALAGVIGKEPATVEPEFLDSLVSNPGQSFPVKLGDKTFNLTLKDVIYDQPKGDFPHPNTMTCRLMAGNDALYELEYYSVGGGFIEWKGYQPPKKGQPKYPYSTMKELLAHADQHQLSIAQAAMANEVAVSGKSEAEVNAFIDKIHTAMVNIVKAGLKAPPGTLPGPIKLKTKAGEVYARAMDDKFEARRAMGARVGVRAGGIGRERARPSRRHRADGRLGRRPAGPRVLARRGRPQPAAAEDPRRIPGRRGDRVPVQAQRHALRRGGRVSGGDWRRVGHGRRLHQPGVRFQPSGRGERGGSGAAAPPGHDLRSGRRVRAVTVHRTMRVRRHQGL